MSSVDGRVDVFLDGHVWLDHENSMDIDAVVAGSGHFAALKGSGRESVNLGYDSATVWIRLPVRVAEDAPRTWLLEVGSPTLDHVTLYRQDASGRWHGAQSGDHVPRSGRPYPHQNLVFPVDLEPGKDEVLFLRIASEGNLAIPLTFWQPMALMQADQLRYAWQALYFGSLLALLTYNLMLFIAIRDPLYLTYSLMVLGMGVGLLGMKGFGSLLIWGDAVTPDNLAFPVSLAVCGLAGALFARRFLESRHRAPRLDRVAQGLTLLFALEAVLGAWLPYSLLARLVSATGLCFSVIAVLLAIRSLMEGQRSARLFLAGWLFLLVGVGVTALRNFGWLPTNGLTSNIMQIGSGLEMLLLSLALADRINSLRQEKDLANAEAVGAERRLVETLRDWGSALEREVVRQTRELREANQRLAGSEALERRGREEQSHFIAMIAHDIRTPLAIIKAAVQSLQDMDSVPPPLEREKRYQRIERALQRLNALLEIALMQDRTNVDDWRMELADIDIHAHIAELSRMLGAADEGRLCFEFAPQIPILKGDPRMLRVMLINLVENALKYSPRDAQVYIETSLGEEAGVPGLFILVIDCGPGIPEGQEEMVFQKYFRSADVAGQPGLGIGLFLARFICTRHGGRLRVVPRPARTGACLEAWLPLVPGEVS
ncbi:sensor histidine kinase [Zoogloea sp.]|uniref:sensor histidine kinase n=1 Tax=Zoogloea sp. TaxID=49181 RepID=UPI0031FCB270